ncbi:hypothetical protein LX36DRAFT_750016 [Colletotrichum falcatum]|nr:hypothetical protein LX36DRAFT_750016 [Colletotrichum falcatum]
MAITQHSSALGLHGNEPQRMKYADQYLQPQGAYTFIESSKDGNHTMLVQKQHSIPKGFAATAFSKTDVAIKGPSMSMNTGKIQIPAHLVDSFIPVDAAPNVAQQPAHVPSALARAFEPAHVNSISADNPSVDIKSEYLHSAELGHHAAGHHAAGHRDVASIKLFGPATQASATAAKHSDNTEDEGGYDKASDSNASTTSEELNASEDQDHSDTGEVSGEEAPENPGQESSDGDSSDESSSEESSSDEDESIPGLARIRALGLPAGRMFYKDARPRWPCNQCGCDYSRRDETRRHLRLVHYVRFYAVVPSQKGIEQARIDCP